MLCSGGRTRTYEVCQTAELQSALVAAGALPNVVASDGFEPPLAESGSAVLTITLWSNVVEPRGVEPRSQDFQSRAYTKSAKAPLCDS